MFPPETVLLFPETPLYTAIFTAEFNLTEIRRGVEISFKSLANSLAGVKTDVAEEAYAV